MQVYSPTAIRSKPHKKMEKKLRYDSSTEDPSWTAVVLAVSMSGLSSVDPSTIERLESEIEKQSKSKQDEIIARREKRAKILRMNQLREQQQLEEEVRYLAEMEQDRLVRGAALREDLQRRIRERDIEKAVKLKEMKEAILARESAQDIPRAIASPRAVQALLESLPSSNAALHTKVSQIEEEGIQTLSHLVKSEPTNPRRPNKDAWRKKKKEFSRHNIVTKDIYTSVTKTVSWSP